MMGILNLISDMIFEHKNIVYTYISIIHYFDAMIFYHNDSCFLSNCSNSDFLQPFLQIFHQQLLLYSFLTENCFVIPNLHNLPDFLIFDFAITLTSQHCSSSLSKYSIVTEEREGKKDREDIYLILFYPKPISYKSAQHPFLKSAIE